MGREVKAKAKPDCGPASFGLSGIDRQAIASANAPLVFFDGVAAHALFNGVGSITVTALHPNVGADGQLALDRVTAAHLRGSIAALTDLRRSIDVIIGMHEAAHAGVPN